MEWYYMLGIISYGIFLFQFICSLIGVDSDLDVDFDGNLDFSASDLLSFKGLIHFLMGFSGWLMITKSVSTISIIFACIVGILFVIVLYFIYKLVLQFQSIPAKKHGSELIGTTVSVYVVIGSDQLKQCICIVNNGGMSEEIRCIPLTPVSTGEKRIITNYKDGIYYIS